MDKRLLDILCCPVTKVPLRLLAANELSALNTAISSGSVLNSAGTHVDATLPAALMTCDGRTIYRIEDDIPVMLADEAIASAQLTEFPR